MNADERRSLRAFLADARSALRAPLTDIIGYGDILLEEAARADGEEMLADLGRIDEAGKRLARLVDDRLDPAKLEREADSLDLESAVATIRHDLRTPLNAIIGYSEMLLEDLEPDRTSPLAGDLRLVNAAGRALLALIEELFSATSLERAAGLAEARAEGRAAAVAGVIDSLGAHAPEAAPLEGAVLVVDDNEANRDLLVRRLGREGCTVHTAESGEQALEQMRARHVDLVLLDVLMPGMNGFEVLERLKASDEWRDVPVVMLSALDEVEGVVRCIETGADDYLSKPFNPVLLRARVGACLEKKRLRDAEKEYLRAVSRLTDAAGAVEAGTFDVEGLAPVAERDDELGRLARVFRTMASEVRSREQKLKKQVADLQIEIDQAKMARQVNEITETDYFRQLRERARNLRGRE